MKQTTRFTIISSLVLTLSAMFLVPSSISMAAERKVTLEELLAKKSIRVKDMHKLNMDVKPGHGPVLWAALDAKREVWFWCMPGVSSALGVGKIVLVATVDANDENAGTIIWPKDKVGHDYGKELEALYKHE
jgi:hypothetical protein